MLFVLSFASSVVDDDEEFEVRPIVKQESVERDIPPQQKHQKEQQQQQQQQQQEQQQQHPVFVASKPKGIFESFIVEVCLFLL